MNRVPGARVFAASFRLGARGCCPVFARVATVGSASACEVVESVGEWGVPGSNPAADATRDGRGGGEGDEDRREQTRGGCDVPWYECEWDKNNAHA